MDSEPIIPNNSQTIYLKNSNSVLQMKEFLSIKLCLVHTVTQVIFSEELTARKRNDEGVRKAEKGILSQAVELFFAKS